MEVNGYSYMIATKEKALCDLLYTKKPVKSKKELYSLLFDSLRIDSILFSELNFAAIIELCDLYHKTNLKYFKKIADDYINGKYRY